MSLSSPSDHGRMLSSMPAGVECAFEDGILQTDLHQQVSHATRSLKNNPNDLVRHLVLVKVLLRIDDHQRALRALDVAYSVLGRLQPVSLTTQRLLRELRAEVCSSNIPHPLLCQQVNRSPNLLHAVHGPAEVYKANDGSASHTASEYEMDGGEPKNIRDFLLSVMEGVRKDSYIPVAFLNAAYVEFGLNWAHFAAKVGVKNFAFFTFDDTAKLALAATGIPSFSLSRYMAEAGAASPTDEANYRSPEFLAMMRVRSQMLHRIVELGFNVILTDLDVVWLDNPSKYFDERFHLEVCNDSPILQSENEMYQNIFINGGLFKVHSSPATISLLRDIAHAVANDHSTDDQQQLNAHLKENPNLKWRFWPQMLFVNGKLFFEERIPQQQDISPVSIHNNWIIGPANKKYRFQEYNLWMGGDKIDGEEKFVIVDRPYAISSAQEMLFVRTSIGLALALNRTLILPRLQYSRYSGNGSRTLFQNVPLRADRDRVGAEFYLDMLDMKQLPVRWVASSKWSALVADGATTTTIGVLIDQVMDQAQPSSASNHPYEGVVYTESSRGDTHRGSEGMSALGWSQLSIGAFATLSSTSIGWADDTVVQIALPDRSVQLDLGHSHEVWLRSLREGLHPYSEIRDQVARIATALHPLKSVTLSRTMAGEWYDLEVLGGDHPLSDIPTGRFSSAVLGTLKSVQGGSLFVVAEWMTEDEAARVKELFTRDLRLPTYVAPYDILSTAEKANFARGKTNRRYDWVMFLVTEQAEEAVVDEADVGGALTCQLRREAMASECVHFN